jgi:hypothetical protein
MIRFVDVGDLLYVQVLGGSFDIAVDEGSFDIALVMDQLGVAVETCTAGTTVAEDLVAFLVGWGSLGTVVVVHLNDIAVAPDPVEFSFA